MSSWPYFADDEIEAVTRVLRSGRVNYWTGEEGRRFEIEFAEFFGVPCTIALANGSVGLELALHAIGMQPGDEVVVPSRTFVASASCVVLRGGVPVFADVDSDSQTITAEEIERVLTPRTKAVIVVHLAGWPCDMDAILDLAHSKGLKVIEDCAQAHGARYRGRLVGTIGDIGVFSFCQDKIMTTGGEGGMLVTADPDIWKRAWSYKDHGKSYEATHERMHSSRFGFRWVHESIGTNWRMTEMQAAIGRIQLRKLAGWLQCRRKNAEFLNSRLGQSPELRITIPPPHVEHAYYKYYVFVRSDELRADWHRDRILEVVNEQQVPCYSGSCSEIYLEKAFSEADLAPVQRLPVARELGETSLMLKVDPTVGQPELLRAADVLDSTVRLAADSRRCN